MSSNRHWLVEKIAAEEGSNFPVLRTVVEAPSCSLYTRTQFTFENIGSKHINITHYVELNKNCSLVDTTVPSKVFLSFDASYSFRVTLYLKTMGI